MPRPCAAFSPRRPKSRRVTRPRGAVKKDGGRSAKECVIKGERGARSKARSPERTPSGHNFFLPLEKPSPLALSRSTREQQHQRNNPAARDALVVSHPARLWGRLPLSTRTGDTHARRRCYASYSCPSCSWARALRPARKNGAIPTVNFAPPRLSHPAVYALARAHAVLSPAQRPYSMVLPWRCTSC